jgi:hypothetical protein
MSETLHFFPPVQWLNVGGAVYMGNVFAAMRNTEFVNAHIGCLITAKRMAELGEEWGTLSEDERGEGI